LEKIYCWFAYKCTQQNIYDTLWKSG
jgi:hypothetical protein